MDEAQTLDLSCNHHCHHDHTNNHYLFLTNLTQKNRLLLPLKMWPLQVPLLFLLATRRLVCTVKLRVIYIQTTCSCYSSSTQTTWVSIDFLNSATTPRAKSYPFLCAGFYLFTWCWYSQQNAGKCIRKVNGHQNY